MFLHRPGGQTQFASPVWVPWVDAPIRAVQNLVRRAPAATIACRTWPRPAAMSVRHFTRVFTAEVGETPGLFVERTRLEAARRELETSGDTLDVVAARCRLGSADTLCRVFQRHLVVSPDAYRRRFRTALTEPGKGPRHDADRPGRHDRPTADRHPDVPEVHRPRRRRALRGAPAHPELRHHLRRPRPG